MLLSKMAGSAVRQENCGFAHFNTRFAKETSPPYPLAYLHRNMTPATMPIEQALLMTGKIDVGVIKNGSYQEDFGVIKDLVMALKNREHCPSLKVNQEMNR